MINKKKEGLKPHITKQLIITLKIQPRSTKQLALVQLQPVSSSFSLFTMKGKKKKTEFRPTDYETLDQRVSPLDSLSFTLFFQMYSIITQ